MSGCELFGYLLVHFVEDPAGHAEKVYFSLSEGDDPLRWRRLNGGQPVLESLVGTTGVRDPFLVRRSDGLGFHILATDLRVWASDKPPNWDELSRHGSRDLVVWDSADLLSWSGPRLVTVAPPTFGMAWAPTVDVDKETGEYLVLFSAKVFDDDDRDHRGAVDASVHLVRTRDMLTFSEPAEYMAVPGGVIDLVTVQDGDRVHVLAKHEAGGPDTMSVFHQIRADFDDADAPIAAERVGAPFGTGMEGPLVFHAHQGQYWYLWVDQYGREPHGFRALRTRDLSSATWQPVPEEEFQIPHSTKHGSVLSLTREEHEALLERFG